MTPYLKTILTRIPTLQKTNIQLFFYNPKSFTPNNHYHLNKTPKLRNYFVAANFNSVGIQSAGGAGKVLADWIARGYPPMDLWGVDIRRNSPFQSAPRYLRDRTTETLGLLYEAHYPFKQFNTARGVRRSVLHDRLQGLGAVFGVENGWERANWFAEPGQAPEYAYSYGRQNWFENQRREHQAVRSAVGVMDQSSFSKYQVAGPGAEAFLNRICANNIAVAPGRVVYTPWLNPRGGIEADVTVTRLSATRYLVVSGVNGQVRDLAWLDRRRAEDDGVVVTDMTSAYAVVTVMGPRARDTLGALTSADLSDAAFPFATSQEIDLHYARVRATRITYVGELGWELYMPTEFAPSVYDAILAAGEAFGIRPYGYHAMNSLRLEKCFRHWGHDITDEDTPLEAGLGFACDLDKPGGFIGRDALLAQRAAGPLRKRLVALAFDDPEPLCYHEEPIVADGEIVGRTTSGMFGHTLGATVAMGYVRREAGVTRQWLESARFEIEVECERYRVTPSLRPFYDPTMQRVKGAAPLPASP